MKYILNSFLIVFLFTNLTFAQKKDSTCSSCKSFSLTHRDILIPSILTGISLISLTDNEVFDKWEIKEARDNWFPRFHSHLDDYLQFAPIAGVFISNVLGVKTKSSFADLCINLAKAEIITELFVFPLKLISHEQRPDQSDYQSFPSGHTAQAFMAATFLHKELADQSIWYSISAYSTATLVGALRIANNKHWVSDVIAGAAFGIFSAHLAYHINIQSHRASQFQISFHPN